MSAGAPRPSPVAEPGWTRWLPAWLVPISLLPDLAAGLPLQTYFFRDFTVTFFPLRWFSAAELRSGRLAFWNPYVFEGTFQLPSFYPPDLLHAVWPSAAFVSWMLTLHLPLAALGAYWLVRELGVSRVGAFASGILFALGGLTLSSLNLHVFLQALALSPFVVGALRRAGRVGGRWHVWAAVLVAAAASTLAVEFVGQAVLLGLVLATLQGGARGALRALLAIGLGVGLAGVPVVVTWQLLPETARAAGFERGVALGNAVHPVVFLQAMLPGLFGEVSAPVERWWGGRFFSKGLPYFISIFVGPVALSLGTVGIGAMERRLRRGLLTLGLLGIIFALGERGGLAPLVMRLPLFASLRFPSKALLLPYLALAAAVGFGLERVRADVRVFRRLAALACTFGAIGMVVALLVWWGPAGLVAWAGVGAGSWTRVTASAMRDGAVGTIVGCAVAATAWATTRGRLRPGLAHALVLALLTLDLARAGVGLNRQVAASFFDPLPEMARFGLSGSGRVFSYGLDQSRSFRGFLARGSADPAVAAFFLSRQILAPYSNVLDRVESPEGKDLTGFAPRLAELPPEFYDPAEVGRLVPWLRQAGVSRLLSLDKLADPRLDLLGTVPAGPPAMAIHVYGLFSPLPRAYVACHVIDGPDEERALMSPYRPGFDLGRDVALASDESVDCRSGFARLVSSFPGEEQFETEADGTGYLVVRASFARGWKALVDGQPARVLRANGKHRAVRIAPGRRRVVLSYHPPGLAAGAFLTVASLIICAGLVIAAGRSGTIRLGG